MVAGNGSAMVYARPGIPRQERWPLARLRASGALGPGHDLIAALTAERAVAFVAAEERPGVVRLNGGRSGEAEIRREDDRVRYQPKRGDPLELGGPLLLSEGEWLERTWDARFPDACVQLLDQFRASRTGDLVVVAKEGYDFRDRFEVPEHRSGHGSLTRAHMQIPVWTSVPGPAGPVRSVDLFPAMLEWLGEPVPAGIDGQLVWTPGRAATVA
jgi:hypothetical protein